MYNPSLSRAELRTLFLARRKEAAAPERQRLSEAIQRHIVRETCWRQAKTVALYVAVRGEAATDLLLQDAWSGGKTVLLPLCDPERAGCMELVPCAGPEQLRSGYCGIPEPVCPEPSVLVVPDLIVVPGVAFDAQGFRLGMGGGFYDRLLARPEYAGVVRLGSAYAFQCIEKLPHEAWDMPVDAVCTEKGVIWTQQFSR